ncbi:unnamed protein product [Pieris brassicae]|uniref:Uncharacterized protein n=1 Tax=Pieris brassicae TaxID=7116 RepID=A0A9P0T3G7_PIEBR|nr:unnamed protein product [Pieris brassicae]
MFIRGSHAVQWKAINSIRRLNCTACIALVSFMVCAASEAVQTAFVPRRYLRDPVASERGCDCFPDEPSSLAPSRYPTRPPVEPKN